MPDSELYCEIRTDGGVYRDWMTVIIQQSYDQSWTRTFRLQAAEPSKGVLRLKPGDRVDIALGGQLVIQEGYVVTRQVAFDSARHGVQIDGFSKAGQITKVSVDVPGGGQFRGYKVDAIASTVLRSHGLKFRVENGPDGHDEPFPNVAVRHGESPFAFLKRLCRQRGLWMRADANGDIVAGSKGSGGLVFEEGQNILAASCSITMPAVNYVIGRSQQPGSDSLFGRKAAEVSATAQMPNGANGKRIILSEMPASAKELQARTNMEMQAIEASLLRVSLTYPGWLKPDGSLWDLSETVKVKSPTLFPTEDGALDLRLWGYAYTQDAQGGTTTAIELVNAATFGIKNADARAQDSFYNQPAKPAQPETPV